MTMSSHSKNKNASAESQLNGYDVGYAKPP
jgi:hypothetical protein